MKPKQFKTIAVKTSPKPEHVHSTMFIEGEIYLVSDSLCIEEKVQKRIKNWVSAAGSQWVLCEDVLPMVYEKYYREEKEKEEFVVVEGKFRNSLGGFEIKSQGIEKTICKEYLKYIENTSKPFRNLKI